jgi:hypothetical protein
MSRERGGEIEALACLSYGRAGPPDPAPRYRTERETYLLQRNTSNGVTSVKS